MVINFFYDNFHKGSKQANSLLPYKILKVRITSSWTEQTAPWRLIECIIYAAVLFYYMQVNNLDCIANKQVAKTEKWLHQIHSFKKLINKNYTIHLF